jgi:large subunit ribosomal protein L4
MSVDVLNWKKEKVGSVDLEKSIFEVPVKKDILHTVVNWQLASRRQGTHMTKTRAFVSGGGKKPFKQKGTGNARQGSNRSPLMPGGAILFGPSPRDYSFALPKKVRALGLRMALSHLHSEGKLFVLRDLEASDGKTKTLAGNLKSFGATKALLVGSAADSVSIKRAASNLPKIKLLETEGVNVFDLLKYDTALISERALGELTKRLAE